MIEICTASHGQFSSIVQYYSSPVLTRLALLHCYPAITLSQSHEYNRLRSGCPGRLWNIEYPSKTHLDSNLVKPRSSITSISSVRLFLNFAQSITVSLPCLVQNFEAIWSPSNKLWANKVSQDLGLRCVWDAYPVLHTAPRQQPANEGL